MAVEFSCGCGRALRVADDKVGRKVKCPKCSAVLTVPATGASNPPAKPTANAKPSNPPAAKPTAGNPPAAKPKVPTVAPAKPKADPPPDEYALQELDEPKFDFRSLEDPDPTPRIKPAPPTKEPEPEPTPGLVDRIRALPTPVLWSAAAVPVVGLLIGLAIWMASGSDKPDPKAVTKNDTRRPPEREDAPPQPNQDDPVPPKAPVTPTPPAEVPPVVHELTHGGKVFCVAVSPDGKWLASAGDSQAIIIWNFADRTEFKRLPIPPKSVIRALAFTKDSRSLITGGLTPSYSGDLRLWDVASGTEVRRFVGHTALVLTVAVSPDGTRMLSGGDDTTVCHWRISDATLINKSAPLPKQINAIAFLPDGKRAVMGRQIAGDLMLWDVEAGALTTPPRKYGEEFPQVR